MTADPELDAAVLEELKTSDARCLVLSFLECLPQLLRDERTRRNIPLRRAALEIGCSATSLANWEKADKDPTVGSVLDAIRWLDWSARRRDGLPPGVPDNPKFTGRKP